MSEFKNPIPADKIPHSPQKEGRMTKVIRFLYFQNISCQSKPKENSE